MQKLVKKNLLSTVAASCGATLWQHLYVRNDDGSEQDVTNGGDTSCALYVSSILSPFGLIDTSHATVMTTLRTMNEAGWFAIDAPRPGAIVEWGKGEAGHEHIGFYVGEGKCVSNNPAAHTPIQHDTTLYDGRTPIAYYWHALLDD